MNWWSPPSRKLRDLVCAAALSSISSTSFALSVTSDNADVQEIGWSKSIALDNANPTNALSSLTSTQPVVSSGVPQNTGVISAPSTVVGQPTTSLSSTPSTVVSQPTISVTNTSSTLASPLPDGLVAAIFVLLAKIHAGTEIQHANEKVFAQPI